MSSALEALSYGTGLKVAEKIARNGKKELCLETPGSGINIDGQTSRVGSNPRKPDDKLNLIFSCT
jgi:hypothetical protein